MSAEDVLSYVNDTRIFNKAGKERVKKLGSGTEKVVEGAAALGTGYVVGLGAAGAAKLTGLKSLGIKGAGRAGKIGALVALAADVLWQMSR